MEVVILVVVVVLEGEMDAMELRMVILVRLEVEVVVFLGERVLMLVDEV